MTVNDCNIFFVWMVNGQCYLRTWFLAWFRLDVVELIWQKFRERLSMRVRRLAQLRPVEADTESEDPISRRSRTNKTARVRDLWSWN